MKSAIQISKMTYLSMISNLFNNTLRAFIFCLICHFYSCDSSENPKNILTETSCDFSHNLIYKHQLNCILNRNNFKFIEISRPEVFNTVHMEGAINFWRPQISNNSIAYNGMRIAQSELEVLLSEHGIKNSDTLVVYDQKGNADAARFWWLMQLYGFDQIYLLDGGIADIDSSYLSTEVNGATQLTAFRFKNQGKSLNCEINEIEAYLENPSEMILVDCRSDDEYYGRIQKNGAYNSGRIPGSIHFDYANLLDYENNSCLKSDTLIRDMLSFLPKDKKVVFYCHSGVRSAFMTFVCSELIEMNNVYNYDGSWTEWTYHDHLPIINDSKILN